MVVCPNLVLSCCHCRRMPLWASPCSLVASEAMGTSISPAADRRDILLVRAI
jgi:hypothetical protein